MSRRNWGSRLGVAIVYLIPLIATQSLAQTEANPPEEPPVEPTVPPKKPSEAVAEDSSAEESAAKEGEEAGDEESPSTEAAGEDSEDSSGEEAPDPAGEGDSEKAAEPDEEHAAVEPSGEDSKPGEAPPERDDEVAASGPEATEYAPSLVAHGSESTTDESALETISLSELKETQVVSATKSAENISDAPSNIEVITARQIKEQGARDLKDVLRRLAGFSVIPDRDEWVFAARGVVSDNNQKYLILIDGHRMNSWENFGPGNIIELPNDLSNVDRIEVIRGPGSAVWGPDALAGVINIVTKRARSLDGNSAHVQGTVGMNGMYRANAQAGHEFDDDVEIMLMGAYAQEAGVNVTQSAATGLPIFNEESGFDSHPFGTYTTRLEKRRPGYFIQGKARVKEFSLNAYHFSSSVFNRHFEYGQGRENYLTSDRYFIEGQHQVSWEGGGGTTRVWTHENRNEYQPLHQGDDDKLPLNIVWLDRQFGASWDARHKFNDFVDVAGGIDFQYTRFGPNQRINAINPEDPTVPTEGFWFDPYLEEHQVGGYAQGRLKLIDRKLQLLAGSRFDYNASRGEDPGNVNPRASLIFTPVDVSTFKLVYNRGFLRPANFQSAGGEVSSETMDQVEFIYMQELGPVSAVANLYYQRLNGTINILAGTLTGFANSGDVESYGGELGIKSPIREHSVFANASYVFAQGSNFSPDLPLNSQRVDPDQRVLTVPSITANGGFTLRFINERLYLTPMARFVGEATYRETPPTDSLGDADYGIAGPFFYLDATAGFDVTDMWGLQVVGMNLTNTTSAQPLSIWNGTVEQYGTYVEGRVQARF